MYIIVIHKYEVKNHKKLQLLKSIKSQKIKIQKYCNHT
jgi:hypothetical protein